MEETTTHATREFSNLAGTLREAVARTFTFPTRLPPLLPRQATQLRRLIWDAASDPRGLDSLTEEDRKGLENLVRHIRRPKLHNPPRSRYYGNGPPREDAQ